MSRPKRSCTFPACGRPHYGHGWCQGHCRQWRDGEEMRPLRGSDKPPHTCPVHPAGTATCYEQGCRCVACTAAKNRAQKRIRAGMCRRVDPTGIRRRLEALAALGWGDDVIGSLMGIARHQVSALRRTTTTVRRDTARRVAAAYDALSMRLPEDTWQARRNRTNAARSGWPPPLAWDDGTGKHGIDNPEASPVVAKRTVRGVAEIEHLVGQGAGLRELMAQLDVGRDAIYRACRRAKRDDLWQLITRTEAA